MSTSRAFPGFEHLYVIRDATSNRAFRSSLLSDLPEDKEFADLMKASWMPQQPLNARWYMGKPEPADIVWGGTIEIVMISERVRKLLEAANLSGWSTYPVVVHGKKGQIYEGYAGLSFTGRCGPIDEERGELLDPDPKFPRYRGIYFDESTWDGSDFFCPTDKTLYMFATEAAKRVFEENKIQGLEFSRLPESTRYRILERG